MSNELIEHTDRPDMWALGLHLIELQKEVRVYSLEQTDLLIKQLALAMLEQIPADVLHTMHVVAVPRGGLFITAELSYLLNWSREQFVNDGRSPVCIVDDCSLTGKRFGETARRYKGRDVWFCHLASAAELREAILKREAQVAGCIAAKNLRLRDQAGQMVLEDDSERYLDRSVNHVAFPWTEPGLPAVLPISGIVEEGWRLLTPRATKGNLASLNLPLIDAELKADIDLPAGVVWRLAPNSVFLFEGQKQKVFELTGQTAELWKRCVGSRNLSWAMAQFQGPNDTIVEELLAKRLLVRI